MKKGFVIIATAIIGALMAGCTMQQTAQNHEDTNATTGSHDTHEDATKGHTPITSEFQFLSEMIPHHKEAIATSLIISQNTAFTPLKNLTTAIASQQTHEVEVMQQWLDQWYSGQVYTGTYKNMMPTMATAIGEMRDRAYLQGMITHHMMAIVMAQQALDLELRPIVRMFAQNIVDVQSKEIETLTKMALDYK